jgi:galactokinase
MGEDRGLSAGVVLFILPFLLAKGGTMKEKIAAKFQECFGGEGTFFASAGRINLIGEHTDYNGGYVFPGAIDKGIMAEIRLNGTDKVRAF